MSMKGAKIQCNIIIAQAKKIYWTEFCKNEVSESNDMYISRWGGGGGG